MGGNSDEALERKRMRRRRKRVWVTLAGVALAVVLVAITWLAATAFQSSAQRDANAQPPEPEPLFVEVNRGDLTDAITLQASAARDDTRQLPVPLTQAASVVTASGVLAGQNLENGSVVFWINGAPVFALEGEFPLYRDLFEGDAGPDVAMIQSALLAMGYPILADGVFGAETISSIRQLYQSVGATAPMVEKPSEVPNNSGRAEGESQTPADQPVSSVPVKVTYVPASSFMVAPGLPAQVSEVPNVGATLNSETAFLKVSSDRAVLSADVSGDVAHRISVGLTGTATFGDETVPVAVSSVGVSVSSDPGATEVARSVVGLEVEGSTIPPDWFGDHQILVSLNLSEPIIDSVLVPVRAIATDVTGQETVVMQQSDSTLLQVDVETIACLGGMCAITDGAVGPGSLLRIDQPW